MGLHNVELYNNLGLSCFYAQQYDMTLACMERALEMATDETLGNLTDLPGLRFTKVLSLGYLSELRLTKLYLDICNFFSFDKGPSKIVVTKLESQPEFLL